MYLLFRENIEIEKIKLSVRAYNCLKNSMINTLDELMALDNDDLIKIRNLGEKSLYELNELRKNVNDGRIPFKDIKSNNYKELNFNDIKLVRLLTEEGKQIETILFYYLNEYYTEDLLIKDLNLSVRSYNGLTSAGFNYVSELLDINYLEFVSIKNLGEKSRKEILRKIKDNTHITYKKDYESANFFTDFEKCIDWILKDFNNSKISFDVTTFKTNIINNLKIITKENLFQFNDIESFLKEGCNSIIYESQFFKSLFKDEIVRNISTIAEATFDDINKFFPKHITETNLLFNLVNNMVEENIIERVEGKYKVYYPTLFEIINNISNERDKLIIESRFSGKTLEKVGCMLNLTRERVRQKEAKIIKKLPRVKEDAFKNIFEKYDWNKDAFIKSFEIDDRVYYYLNYKYTKGTIELEKTLEDNNIPVKVRQRIESFIYKDYLLVGNTRIKKEKQHILEYVLKSFCKDDISVDDLRDIYAMFLEDFNLYSEKLKYPIRYFESTLANSNKVLWKLKKRLRYFDFSEFNAQKIISILSLEKYQNVEISALKIFNDYNEVMDEWGIKDEYELHNLMKKVIGDKNDLGIKFLRMPNIEFGNADRDMQVLELLIQSAPIENYNLAKLYEIEYGVKVETALANYFKSIEEYYHQGKYSIDYKSLNHYELEEMKEVLNDDIYLLNEVKDLYKKKFPQGDIATINPYSLRCLGFKVTSLFIYSDKFTSLEDFIKQKILNNDIFDATNLIKRFSNNQSFYNTFKAKKFEYEIIEFEPNIFITRNRLERNGINKKDLLDFVKSVDEFIDEEIFTIKLLKKRGFEHYLDNLGFGELFYSSILKYSEKYKSRRVDGSIIFKKSKDIITLNDLIEHIVTKFRKIDVYDLIDYVYEEYGIRINKWKISNIANEKELYYDSIMEKIYIDYDEYFEEI